MNALGRATKADATWTGFDRAPAISQVTEADIYGLLACDPSADITGCEWWGQPRRRYGPWTPEPFEDQVRRVKRDLGLIVCTCLGVQIDDDKRVLIYSPTCEVHGRHRRAGDRL